MCLPKPKDPSVDIANQQAASARQQEAERQARIDQGRASIDSAFSQYGDGYYDKVKTDYLGYYNPQLDEQYAEARKNLIFNLARNSILESDAGTTQLSKLEKKYKDQQAGLGNAAAGAANDARSRVENERSTLHGLNVNAADPALIGERATAASANIGAAPVYSPLGQIFADIINQGAQGVTLQAKGYPGFGTGFPKLNFGGSGNSGYVVS